MKRATTRIFGGILAGCVLFTTCMPGTAYAESGRNTNDPYETVREPQYAYSPEGMTAAVGTQQEGDYGGNRVLDSNADTLWEGAWDQVELEDAWIVLDLGEPRTVSGIAELPRPSRGNDGDMNGVITGYDIEVSTDGGETYVSMTQGVWDEYKEWKYAHFDPVENVTHVRLQATSVSRKPQNPDNVTIAELRVLGDAVEKGSTEELELALEQVSGLKEEDYTTSSWETLQNAVKAAEDLMQKEMYVQDEIDPAAERLQEAVDGLKKVEDLGEISQKLAEAKAIDNSDNYYYKNTFYALQKVIEETEYESLDGLTDEEASVYSEKLQNAIDGLIVRDVNDQNAFDTTPAKEAVSRLLGEENQDRLQQIEFRAIDKKECDYDYYEYYEQDGKLVIAATTNASILTGFNHWLKYVAECNISWKGDQVNLPEQLPMPEEPVYQSTNAQRRFAGNDMTEQYDGNYWSWEDWEREIDLLALNGFNQVLVYVGQESVFYKTFEELGVDNMLDEMPRVSFVPSLFLGGSWRFKADHANDSSNIMTSMTPDIMEKRLEIGQKVCARLKELGMEPIMPGCSGYLAYGQIDGIPQEDIVSQGDWASMPRPGWLKSTSEFYPKLASTYYRIQEELFGECKNWKIDLFNEGGTLGGVDAAEAGRIIQQEMLKVHPDATWHIMHWTGPNPDILKGTDTSKVFIHDIKTTSLFDREETWNGAEYGFSHLNSMGSRTTMGSRVKDLSEEYWERMEKPGTKLDGIGVAPEGGHHEPIVLESLGELAWQNGPTDGEHWFLDYADRRYGMIDGQPDEHARRAWEILGETVYDKTGNNPVGDILFAMTPSHDGTMASPTGPGTLGFDSEKMAEALNELLQVDPALRETETYQYDLILVTAQVFTAYSREALPKIKEAFDSGDAGRYEELTQQWLEAILALDKIAGTNENFMLGTWIEDAVNIASTEEGKKLMEMDAKEINTIWGPRVSGAKSMFLNYANKTWSGYLKDLYYKQWDMFFSNNLASLKGEEQPYPEVATTNGAVDYDKWYEALWFDFGEGTGQFEGVEYPTEPAGDTYELVKEGLKAIDFGEPARAENIDAVYTVSGVQPILPDTVSAVTDTGENVEAAVQWNLENEDFTESTTITGKVEGTLVRVTANVIVVPENIQYFINCNNPGSAEYARTDAYADLLNEVPDQSYTDGGWGYLEEYGPHSGNPDDSYDVGWYAYSGQDIKYTVPLAAGTYQVDMGFKEWWNQDRPMRVSVTAEGQTTELGTTNTWKDGNPWNVETYEFTCGNTGEVTFTVSADGGPDPVLSYIRIRNILDTQGLKDALAETAALDRSQYDTAELEDLDAAAAAAHPLLYKSSSDQAAIDAAAELLKSELAELEGGDQPEEPSETTDKSSLNLVIGMAEKLEAEQAEAGCYTEESWAAVQTALDTARTLAADENASQEDVDNAFLDLITAVNLLENAVQRVGLQAAIEGAKAIFADTEGLEQYTPESVEELRTALAEAERVYAEESADQETVNAASRALMDAVTSLVVVDVETRLDILIRKAEELLADSEQYTSASVENLQAALDAAKLAAENRDASDAEINEAYTALAEAMTSLVRKADKSELKTALDKAASILADTGRYVEDTITGLQAAAVAAQAVYDKEDASPAEVGGAVKSLVDEILKARLLGDVDGNGAVDSADSAMVLKYAAEAQEFDEMQSKAADINGDGSADSIDASEILRYASEAANVL